MRPWLSAALAGFAALSCSTTDATSPPDLTPVAITSGVPVVLTGASSSVRNFTIVVPAGTSRLLVTLSGGTGDADVFVNPALITDRFSAECSSTSTTSTEECEIDLPAAATWHVQVYGFGSYSDVTLTVTAEPVVALTSGASVSISGASGSVRHFSVTVPAGATNLTVATTGGTGDPDLRIRFNAHPTDTTSDCSSANFGSDDSCDIAGPSSGTWYIRVSGFTSYANVSLTATVN